MSKDQVSNSKLAKLLHNYFGRITSNNDYVLFQCCKHDHILAKFTQKKPMMNNETPISL